MSFQRLVRFEKDGAPHYGDLLSQNDEGYTVQRLEGNIQNGFTRTTEEPVVVSKLLCPIESTPIVICVGLNYQKHANEASLKIPPYPIIFTKPATSITGPTDLIHVHPKAQPMLDYEGELTFVTSRDIKNLPEDFDLADCVLGYTAGNDVSARNFQLPDVSGGQYCFAKSFDTFAPIGPALVSPSVIPDPQKLKYVTRVNGEVLQDTGTDDMIWTVKQILQHISIGTTVKAGTVVMTGTPSGVGLFRQKFLKDGDAVEVDVEGLGSLKNVVKFE
ncbi:hypothetical protein N7474_008314 [Penicillium riverlandense]|uniref:uncharacterized protein n=1 Tax=Penicillium riverlandense TaxID=1903569 RepID=UPI002548F7B4|nr:uncharacterized protein N7474_008314 [Penicillium riverlandense]KAJ5812013.1 hypothetical protein N7474_008314 [Penicillium riverlandense]